MREIEHPKLQSFFQWADGLATHYGEQSRSAALKIQLLATISVVSGRLLTILFDENVAVVRVLSSIELATALLLVLDGLGLLASPGMGLAAGGPAAVARPACAAGPGVCRALIGGLLETRRRKDLRGAPFPGDRSNDQAAGRAGERTILAERHDRLAMVVGSRPGFSRSLRSPLCSRSTAWRNPLTEALQLAVDDYVFGAAAALGAAFASIAAQDEYKRLARRARGMHVTLSGMVPLGTETQTPTYAALVIQTRRVCEVLTSEVRDWQVLVSIRKPSLPT